MKILLMLPKVIHESWPFPTDFWRCFKKVPGVTLPQLAAVLPEHQCDIFDGNVETISLQQYATMLARYDVVAISVVSSAAALNSEITIKLIKALSPKTTVVIGGHHATFNDVQWVERGADVVIRREGEDTLRKVIEALDSGAYLGEVGGITFRGNDGARVNSDRKLISDLDALPFPSWEKVRLSNYDCDLGGKGFVGTVETSRGCSHQCTFCCAGSMWKHCQRYKSPERVLEELRHLYGLGVDNVFIADDNFGARPERDMEILEGIVRDGMRLHLWMFCRVDSLLSQPDFVDLAVRAGLAEATVGYESLCPETLKNYNKGLARDVTIERYEEAYSVLRRNGVLVFGGFVGDVRSAAKKTVIPRPGTMCDVVMYQDFIPMRGVAGYDDLIKENLIAGDTFYFDRYIPAYNARKGGAALLQLWRHLRALFSLHMFRLLFFSGRRNRKALFGIYTALVGKLFSVTPRKLRAFMTSVFPWRSPGERQERVVSRFTDDSYIDGLLRKSGK